MTWFSLKRTLQSNLASTIEVLNPINPSLSKPNLHTPLRYSVVSSSIGKITNICHQNIPLKRVHQSEAVTYISAISLKLERIWQRSAGEIASVLLPVLQEQTSQPLWSSVRETNGGWIEFVVAQQGMTQWRHVLNRGNLPIIAKASSYPVEAQALWQLQSGYELCCRWQACYRQLKMSSRQFQCQCIPTEPFLMPPYPLQALIHGLLDMSDFWDDSAPSQRLQQARRLVLAIEQCTSAIGPAAAEAAVVNQWFEPTQRVMKQLLSSSLGYPLTAQF